MLSCTERPSLDELEVQHRNRNQDFEKEDVDNVPSCSENYNLRNVPVNAAQSEKYQVYIENMRRVIFTARHQIERLNEQNKRLQIEVESDSVVKCPSCLFLHKTKENRFLPHYIKASPGRFTLELIFKSKEELFSFMIASRLEHDENGIPVVTQTEKAEPESLLEAGSSISKLVEAEKQKEKIRITLGKSTSSEFEICQTPNAEKLEFSSETTDNLKKPPSHISRCEPKRQTSLTTEKIADETMKESRKDRSSEKVFNGCGMTVDMCGRRNYQKRPVDYSKEKSPVRGSGSGEENRMRKDERGLELKSNGKNGRKRSRSRDQRESPGKKRRLEKESNKRDGWSSREKGSYERSKREDKEKRISRREEENSRSMTSESFDKRNRRGGDGRRLDENGNKSMRYLADSEKRESCRGPREDRRERRRSLQRSSRSGRERSFDMSNNESVLSSCRNTESIDAIVCPEQFNNPEGFASVSFSPLCEDDYESVDEEEFDDAQPTQNILDDRPGSNEYKEEGELSSDGCGQIISKYDKKGEGLRNGLDQQIYAAGHGVVSNFVDFEEVT